MKPRNPYVLPARNRHAGFMKHKCEPRGGGINQTTVLMSDLQADDELLYRVVYMWRGEKHVAVDGFGVPLYKARELLKELLVDKWQAFIEKHN